MNDNTGTSIKNLRAFLAAARHAVRMAKVDNPDARGMAGIGWKLPSGSGKLVSNFDSEPFCDDLERVLDALSQAQGTDNREAVDAFLRGALAMRSKCRDIADDYREAIDDITPRSLMDEDMGQTFTDMLTDAHNRGAQGMQKACEKLARDYGDGDDTIADGIREIPPPKFEME